MSNPKRHHFVPKAYLKGFVDESSDFLHVYSKREGKWRKQKPKEVMVRNKYYHQGIYVLTQRALFRSIELFEPPGRRGQPMEELSSPPFAPLVNPDSAHPPS